MEEKEICPGCESEDSFVIDKYEYDPVRDESYEVRVCNVCGWIEYSG